MQHLVRAHFELLGLQEKSNNVWWITCHSNENGQKYFSTATVEKHYVRYKQVKYHEQNLKKLFRRIANDLKGIKT